MGPDIIPLAETVEMPAYDLSHTAVQTTAQVFDGHTVSSIVTDASDVVTVAAPLGIIIAFYGAFRLAMIIRRFVGRGT